MSNPWPERDYYESTEDYLVRMVQQLFVELAELRTLVAKQMTPIYQMNAPEDEDLVAIRKRTAEADLEAALLRLASARKPEKWEGLNYLQGQFQVPNLVPDEEKP